MYSKHEVAKLKQEFWTTFGRYMTPVLSADGEKMNWINYKTGEKYIHFKMQANNLVASIGIELSHPDPNTQELYFNQFMQQKKMLQVSLSEEWIWELHAVEDGKSSCKIYSEIKPVSILNKDEWGNIISFLKPRIIALDAFWSVAKYSFEAPK